MKLPRTQIEQDYGRAFTDAEWSNFEALDAIAERLARYCCSTINTEALAIPPEPIKHQAQHTLEALIAKLQTRV